MSTWLILFNKMNVQEIFWTDSMRNPHDFLFLPHEVTFCNFLKWKNSTNTWLCDGQNISQENKSINETQGRSPSWAGRIVMVRVQWNHQTEHIHAWKEETHMGSLKLPWPQLYFTGQREQQMPRDNLDFYRESGGSCWEGCANWTPWNSYSRSRILP